MGIYLSSIGPNQNLSEHNATENSLPPKTVNIVPSPDSLAIAVHACDHTASVIRWPKSAYPEKVGNSLNSTVAHLSARAALTVSFATLSPPSGMPDTLT